MHTYTLVTVTPAKVTNREGKLQAEPGGLMTTRTIRAHTSTGALQGRGKVVSESSERLSMRAL